MVERGVKFDRVSFNAALCACAVLGLTGKALELFDRMQEHGPSGATGRPDTHPLGRRIHTC
eukprot:6922103-Pyramimonas_sp.AAC.1